jgi:hypothetical protein
MIHAMNYPAVSCGVVHYIPFFASSASMYSPEPGLLRLPVGSFRDQQIINAYPSALSVLGVMVIGILRTRGEYAFIL